MDRMIQQAVLQILQPFFDPTFSNDSYGFRPKRSAHQAIQRAQEHILAGYDWVVDLDLERFFDRAGLRRADGTSGTPGEGQADGATDPALLAGRVDGGRAGIAADGGYTARGARCHLW